MSGLFAYAFSRGSQLSIDLKAITDVELVDSADKEVLSRVKLATNSPDGRKEILQHLQACISESSTSKWRRTHGGLVLLDHLLRDGAPQVVSEISQGMHFDPIQRLTFLERFEFKEDIRVQNVIKQKAAVLRAELINRLNDPDSMPAAPPPRPAATKQSPTSASNSQASVTASPPSNFANCKGFGSDDIAAKGGLDNVKAGIANSSAFVGFGSDSPMPPPGSGQEKGRNVVLNGLVSVGHRDDTDSSEDEGPAPTKRQDGHSSHKATGATKAAQKKAMDDSTDSEASDSSARRARRKARKAKEAVAKPPAAVAAQEVDLLGGMFGDEPAAAAQQPAAPAGTADLLDF